MYMYYAYFLLELTTEGSGQIFRTRSLHTTEIIKISRHCIKNVPKGTLGHNC